MREKKQYEIQKGFRYINSQFKKLYFKIDIEAIDKSRIEWIQKL